MMKPGAGNNDSFCSKLSQGDLKGIVKTPCEHKIHTKNGPGSGSGSEGSPKSFFSGMRYIIYSHFCTYNSKIDAILQSDPVQVNESEGSVQHRITLGPIL